MCAQVDVGLVNSWLLTNLTSVTSYSVAVVALYDEGQAVPTTNTFTTSGQH